MNKIYRPEVDRPHDIELIKWLRSKGTLGVDFKFYGSGQKLQIEIMNDRLEFEYILKWEWTK